MKKIIMISICLTLWSGQALAFRIFSGCQTPSITASTPTIDFTINGNGTVTHKKTGLMWKRCSEGQVWNGSTCTGIATTSLWRYALRQAQTLNNSGGFAGFTDWRVPNKKELDSIVEAQCTFPSINTTIFPATDATGRYWSSSPFANDATVVWIVNFGQGNDDAMGQSFSFNVRFVRSDGAPHSGTQPGVGAGSAAGSGKNAANLF